MTGNIAARRYGASLYDLAQEENKLEVYRRELIAANATISQNKDLQTLWLHPAIGREEKKSVIRTLFQQELNPHILHFLLLLIDRRREGFLPAIVAEFNRLVDEAKGVRVAQVASAIPLTEEEKQNLRDQLRRKWNREVELTFAVDRRLIGGLIVRSGDEVWDASLATRLQKLSSAFTVGAGSQPAPAPTQ